MALNRKQKTAVGGTLLFVGAGAIALVLIGRKKPKTYMLHYKPLDEAHAISVLDTLENHGEIFESTHDFDDSLFIRWKPDDADWAGVPEEHHAAFLISQEEAQPGDSTIAKSERSKTAIV